MPNGEKEDGIEKAPSSSRNLNGLEDTRSDDLPIVGFIFYRQNTTTVRK